jgi:hypothetical protein
MTSKFFILMVLNYIIIHASFDEGLNERHHIIQDPLLPPRHMRSYGLYGIKDWRGAITPTTISVIGAETSTNICIQNDSFFYENPTRRIVPKITLNDEDPIESYLQSKEKECCLLSCLLRCLGIK